MLSFLFPLVSLLGVYVILIILWSWIVGLTLYNEEYGYAIISTVALFITTIADCVALPFILFDRAIVFITLLAMWAYLIGAFLSYISMLRGYVIDKRSEHPARVHVLVWPFLYARFLGDRLEMRSRFRQFQKRLSEFMFNGNVYLDIDELKYAYSKAEEFSEPTISNKEFFGAFAKQYLAFDATVLWAGATKEFDLEPIGFEAIHIRDVEVTEIVFELIKEDSVRFIAKGKPENRAWFPYYADIPAPLVHSRTAKSYSPDLLWKEGAENPAIFVTTSGKNFLILCVYVRNQK